MPKLTQLQCIKRQIFAMVGAPEQMKRELKAICAAIDVLDLG